VTDESRRAAAEEQDKRTYSDPWVEKVANYLRPLTITTIHKVMQIALGMETKEQSKNYKHVGRIVQQLGWETSRLTKPGQEDRGRYLIRKNTDLDKIKWEDLGGATLAVIHGGKSK
jgi:hypothetical protein